MLQLSMQPLMLSLDHPAGQASLEVPSDLSLHAQAPVAQTQISVHLGSPQEDKEVRIMSLLQYNLYDSTRHRNPYSTTTGQQSPTSDLPYNPIKPPVLLSYTLCMSL